MWDHRTSWVVAPSSGCRNLKLHDRWFIKRSFLTNILHRALERRIPTCLGRSLTSFFIEKSAGYCVFCCIEDSCDSWDIVEQQARQGGGKVDQEQLQMQRERAAPVEPLHRWTQASTSSWPASSPLLPPHWSTQVRRRLGGDTGFTSTQLIWGEDRRPNEQLLFTLVTASQVQGGKLELANIPGRRLGVTV